jgi:metal-responsive CopG/Arc/MetJ family transcriptional regulator
MPNNKRVKIQITLPAELVDRIDISTKEELISKSNWFARAVEHYFKTYKKEKPKTMEKRIEIAGI